MAKPVGAHRVLMVRVMIRRSGDKYAGRIVGRDCCCCHLWERALHAVRVCFSYGNHAGTRVYGA